MLQNLHSTTILCVRKKKKVSMIGDGQVSMGSTIIKNSAMKIRTLSQGEVLSGFAGATADAFTLYERLEKKIEEYPDLTRACVELAKQWRMDKYLRRLEAMMIVANSQVSLMLGGNGDVLEPEDDVISIGSGGPYALAAARALMGIKSMGAEEVAKKAMEITSSICIYTNDKFVMKSLDCCERK